MTHEVVGRLERNVQIERHDEPSGGQIFIGLSVSVNSGTQNMVCDRNVYNRTIKFGGSCDNDEARSLVLTSVRKGTVLRVYDDPDCETGDDWTRIEVLQDLSRYTVNTFESDGDNEKVSRNYHSHNGLDGKVSCVKITGVP